MKPYGIHGWQNEYRAGEMYPLSTDKPHKTRDLGPRKGTFVNKDGSTGSYFARGASGKSVSPKKTARQEAQKEIEHAALACKDDRAEEGAFGLCSYGAGCDICNPDYNSSGYTDYVENDKPLVRLIEG